MIDTSNVIYYHRKVDDGGIILFEYDAIKYFVYNEIVKKDSPLTYTPYEIKHMIEHDEWDSVLYLVEIIREQTMINQIRKILNLYLELLTLKIEELNEQRYIDRINAHYGKMLLDIESKYPVNVAHLSDLLTESFLEIFLEQYVIPD